MDSQRTCLAPTYKVLHEGEGRRRETHAGIWLDRYIASQEERHSDKLAGDRQKEAGKARRTLVDAVSALPVPALYRRFYEQWEQHVKAYGAECRLATVKGRMIVGLGHESVVETSVALHRTYGVPYIPGSALKGLAASYARQVVKAYPDREATCHAIFGDTTEAGYVTFFDALYQPGSAHKPDSAHKPNSANDDRPLSPDVITVHHKQYYQGGQEPPADWDNPNPIPFLSATGSYLVALAAPDVEGGPAWVRAAFEILGLALKDMGIGAKTSSGYGRMELAPFHIQVQANAERHAKR
ncbi:MAG: type III-B CRISPR module RAMP protein Cmr6 [Ktedonobacteraceae bacterium]|nr:type III-B CRISPR module RAMP protein Cmr6 [Ktedonobacteraceae bacterium]